MPSARKHAVKEAKARRAAKKAVERRERRERQGEGRRVFRGTARAAQRRSAGRYVGTVTIHLKVQWEGSELTEKTVFTDFACVSEAGAKVAAAETAQDMVRRFRETYGTAAAELVGFEITKVVPVDPVPAATQRMRTAGALSLDGDAMAHDWDRGVGTCVLDYLFAREKDATRFKKMFKTLDRVALVLLGYYDPAPPGVTATGRRPQGRFMHDPDKPLPEHVAAEVEALKRDGVQTDPHLVNYGKAVGAPVYALHQDDDEPFLVYEPPGGGNGSNGKVLCFRVVSGHMYPMEGEAMRTISYRVRARRAAELGYGHAFYEGKRPQGDDGETTPVPEGAAGKAEAPTIVMHSLQREDDAGKRKSGMQILADAMVAERTHAFKYKTLCFDGEDVTAFSLNNRIHCVGEHAQVAKLLVERQGGVYAGEALGAVLKRITEPLLASRIRSTPNQRVLASLVRAKKARAHMGYYGAAGDRQSAQLRDELAAALSQDRARAVDIAKCYPTCLCSPLEDWMAFNHFADWELYPGPQPEEAPSLALRPGLYLVDTHDTLLLHRDGVYSSGILRRAAAEGIPFRIRKQLLATSTQGAGLYRPVFAAIVRLCGANPKLYKFPNNVITGMLGRHETSRSTLRITQDIQQVWTWLFEQRKMTMEDNWFVKTVRSGEHEFYFHGYADRRPLSEVDIPHYVQMMDAANVRLYDAARGLGGALRYRKVDFALAMLPPRVKKTREEARADATAACMARLFM